jgi:hypothetical protein
MSLAPALAGEVPLRQALMELSRELAKAGVLPADKGRAAPPLSLILHGTNWTQIGRRSSLPEPQQLRQELLERLERSDSGFLDLEVLQRRRPVTREIFSQRFSNIQRGLLAMEIVHRYETELVPPSRTLRENRSFARSIDLFRERRGLSEAVFWRTSEVASYEVDAWRLTWKPAVSLVRLFRQDHLVQPAEITPDAIGELARSLAGWLVRTCAEDGTIPYKYWPSRGEEAKEDNALRRFMGTVWLNRWAQQSGDATALGAADRNLRRNLKHYYRERDGRGFIEHDGKAKLGAAAFAAMVLRESPLRGELAETLSKIDAGIEHLWQPDGSFRTFAWPDRNDNQNFYPGEALLYLAQRHRETGEPWIVEKALKSLAWYRDWHLQNRNPAFVPWHTQAAALFHAASGESWLRDWVFTMNDWLLPIQQLEVAEPDVHGRFFDPSHAEYGPPHASSTGVYLEGLADAFAMAEAAGDSARAQRYARAIWAGIRNLRQLQFRDEPSMGLYTTDHRLLLGGIRTEVYDNTVRVDNVQHALGAMMKLLEQPAFLATAGQRPTAPLSARGSG